MTKVQRFCDGKLPAHVRGQLVWAVDPWEIRSLMSRVTASDDATEWAQ